MAGGLTTAWQESRLNAGRLSKGSPVPWQRLAYELRQQLEPDAVIVEEQGTEYKSLGMFPFADDAMMKIGRTEGRALGWGVGASAGVKLALPNRQVIALQGDGGYLFGQNDSLWTMSRYDIPVMIVVFNNGTYEETRWQIMGRMGPAGSGQSGLCFLSRKSKGRFYSFGCRLQYRWGRGAKFESIERCYQERFANPG